MKYSYFNTLFYVNILDNNNIYIADLGYSKDIDMDFFAIVNAEKEVIQIDPGINCFSLCLTADISLYEAGSALCEHSFSRKWGEPNISRERKFNSKSEIKFIILKSLYECRKCRSNFITECIYKVTENKPGGKMSIFDSLKNPFKGIIINNKMKEREKDLLIQFDDSMNRIALIEMIKTDEALEAYLNLFKTRLNLKPDQYYNLIFKLAFCCRLLNKYGLALHFLCLAPVIIEDQNIIDKFHDLKLELIEKASSILQANKQKIKVLSVNKTDNNVETDPVPVIIEKECFQYTIEIESRHYFNELKHKDLFKEYNVVILSSSVFTNMNSLINEYSALINEFPGKEIFIRVPLIKARFIKKEFKELYKLISIYDKHALYAAVLMGIESKNLDYSDDKPVKQ